MGQTVYINQIKIICTYINVTVVVQLSRGLNKLKLDYVLNTQEVIECKVKELNDILKQASKNGLQIDVDTIKSQGVMTTSYQILVDVKVNPKLLEIK